MASNKKVCNISIQKNHLQLVNTKIRHDEARSDGNETSDKYGRIREEQRMIRNAIGYDLDPRFKKMFEFLEAAKDEKKVTLIDLENIIDEVRDFNVLNNSAISALTGNTTAHMIMLGEIFNALKVVVRNAKIKWEQWARENLKFSKSKRTRQDYMKMAKVPNIYKWAFLGKEKVLKLVIATDAHKKTSGDPIGDFICKHRIFFEPEVSSEELNKLILIALTSEKLEDVKLNIRRTLIEGLINCGYSFEKNNTIPMLVNIKNAGGDPNQKLQDIFRAKGNDKTVRNSKSKAQQRRYTFDRAAAIIKDTVNTYLENVDKQDQIEPCDVAELISELEAFYKELLSPLVPMIMR